MAHSCKLCILPLEFFIHSSSLTCVFRYHAEPSGTFYRYDAKAIGSGSEGAQVELQNEYHSSLTIEEAEVLALKILKQVMEEKLDAKNAQLASVTKEEGFKIYDDEMMKAVVEKMEAQTSGDDELQT